MGKKQHGQQHYPVIQSPQGAQGLTHVITQVTIEGINFVPSSEYERVVAENTRLRQRVAELEGTQTQLRMDLANKDRELMQIKADNEHLKHRITQLEQDIGLQSNKIDEQSVKIKQLETELNTIKTYQKFADSSKGLFNSLYDTFCGDNSAVRAKSKDTDLYHLCDNLIEFCTKRYSKWSKVRKDLPLWSGIHADVKDVLQTEYNISDINIFFEIIQLRSTRNSCSHNTSLITLDELKSISKYADQIWACLS